LLVFLQVTLDRYGHLSRSEDHSRAMDAIAKKIYVVAEPIRARMDNRPSKSSTWC
jgi:hypothetical protein